MEWQPPQVPINRGFAPEQERISGREESFVQLVHLDQTFTQANSHTKPAGSNMRPNFMAADMAEPEGSPGWDELSVAVTSSFTLQQFYELVILQARELNKSTPEGKGFISEVGFDADISLVAQTNPSSGELYSGTPVFEISVRDVHLGLEWK